MRTENPVQLGKERIAMVFTGDVAPAAFEIKPKPEEFAEVIRKVRSDAFALQCRVRNRGRIVEPHARILSPVKLPLGEDARSFRAPDIACRA